MTGNQKGNQTYVRLKRRKSCTYADNLNCKTMYLNAESLRVEVRRLGKDRADHYVS